MESSILPGYQPLDLDSVFGGLPKNMKKLQSDRDVENEVNDVNLILKNLTADWKKRAEACQRVINLATIFDQVCQGQLPRINVQTYLKQMEKIAMSLAVQIHDLRSMSAKSAHTAIQVLAQSFGNDFESLALKLVTKEALIKVLHNGNKTLSEHAHMSILGIINHVCVPKLLSRFQIEMNNSKSAMVHAKMSQYLLVLVSIYPFEGVLERHATHIDNYVQQCVGDANPDARLYGRKSFLMWQKLAPDNAQNVFALLDYQAQKAIVEEQDRQGVSDGGFVPAQKQAAKKNASQGSTAASNFGNSSGSNPEPKQKRPVSKDTRRSGGKAANKGSVSRGSRRGQGSQNRQSLGVYSQQNSAEQQVPQYQDPKSPGLPNTKVHQIGGFGQLPQVRATEPVDYGAYVQKEEQIDFYKQQQSYDQYGDQQDSNHRADEEMEIEPMGQSFQQFSYTKIVRMLKSHKWSQRAQALEDFLRYLIEMQPNELMAQLKSEQEFSQIIEIVIQKLDTETVIRIIEISLDLIELLLSSLPECLIPQIDEVIICFLKQLSSRREMISDKANDLINLARETLGADFLLPHFIAILEKMAPDISQVKTKISALEVLNVLIKESDSLENDEDKYTQYVAVLKTLSNILKSHSAQKLITNPVVAAIQSLRDKEMDTTFKAISEELNHTQYTILRQVLNVHDKTLSRQLVTYQQQAEAQVQEQQIPQQQEEASNVEQYQNPYFKAGQVSQPQPTYQEAPQRSSSGRPDSANRSSGGHRGQSGSRTSSKQMAQAQIEQNQRVPYQSNEGQSPQIVGLDKFKPQQVVHVNASEQGFLIQQCQNLINVGKTNQMESNPQAIVQSLKKIQNAIVSPDSDPNAQQLIFQNLETLIDSLLYIVQLSTSEAKQQQQYLLLQQNNIRNTCIEILTYIIKQTYRNQMQKNLDIHRDDILVATLKAYSPDIAPQHQCITNQVAEDLLEQLVISCDVDFIASTIEPLLRTEQPPRLQALLRMVQNKLRFIQKLQIKTFSPNQVQNLIENLVCLSEVLAHQMSNQNADVRKSVVFCMVEIHSVLQEDQIFQEVFLDKLNQSQQKLVDIYITRKRQIDQQKEQQ